MTLDISSPLYDVHLNTTQAGEGPEIHERGYYYRPYTVQNNDGTAADLTGYTIACRFADDTGTLIFTGVIVASAADLLAGKFAVTIPSGTGAGSTGSVSPVLGTSVGTVCAPAAFEGFEDPTKFQLLDFDVTADDTVNGPQPIVKGQARFYESTIA